MRNASEIAKEDLQGCYSNYGIIAGQRNYPDYWTRDAYFGWLGAEVLGDLDTVKKHLILLSQHQKSSGHIPFIIRQHFPILPFFGIKRRVKKIYPKYRSHKALYTSTVVDSNCYFILGLADYLKRTGDADLILKLKTNIKQAMIWYTKQLKNNLFHEGYIAQWNDGIYKSGATLLTNLQVYKSLKSCVELFKTINEDTNNFEADAEKIKSAIMDKFWNGTYLIDFINKEKKYDFFDTIANMLAIIWGLVDQEKAGAILNFARQNTQQLPLIKLNYPEYPLYRTEVINMILGNKDYCRNEKVAWLEPALLNVWALHTVGKVENAEDLFSGITKLIEKHNGVFEVYYKKNNEFVPLNKLIYKSEHPFARSSGLYIHLYNMIKIDSTNIKNNIVQSQKVNIKKF